MFLKTILWTKHFLMTAVDICFGCLVSILPFPGNSIGFSSEEPPCPFSGYRIQRALKSPPHTSFLILNQHLRATQFRIMVTGSQTDLWPKWGLVQLPLGMAQNNVRHSFSTWVTEVVEYKPGCPSTHLFAIVEGALAQKWTQHRRQKTKRERDDKSQNISRTPWPAKSKVRFIPTFLHIDSQ